MRVNWYASKRSIVAGLDPLVRALAQRRIAPDAVTLAAVPIAAIGGVAIVLSPRAPALLLLVPIAAALRLGTNLLDGALARTTGQSRPRGELLNEVTDRVCDVLLLAPVAFVPGAEPLIVSFGIVVAVLASFIGVASKAAGGERLYGGVLSKPGRMVLLAGASLVTLVGGPWVWAWFGYVLLVGASLTTLERLAVAWRTLP
jgi:phosphatidylglycerophosphate synthase